MFLKPVKNGSPVKYFCGHSLGLQPVKTKEYINQELEKWAVQGVEGHFEGPNPWFHYHLLLKKGLSHLCGAKESEVVAYGSLSSNLHNLFASFYQPTEGKYKILAEETGFPSDTFALQTQVAFHGYKPEEAIIFLRKDENYCFDTEHILEQIKKHHQELALIWLSGVNFLSGQVFDLKAIAACAKEYEVKIGIDLAHAIGNVPLQLHDWDIDFAVWCSYKYLNSGPGATGGYFVHEKHFPQLTTHNPQLTTENNELTTHNPQPTTVLGGWWGNNETTRFQTGQLFSPVPNADAWQHSNANVISLPAVRASLDIFMEADINKLYNKSQKITNKAIETLLNIKSIKILTPGNQNGNMISILFPDGNKAVMNKLSEQNFLVDWRDSGIMRFSFNPLYNDEQEWDQFISYLAEIL